MGDAALRPDDGEDGLESFLGLGRVAPLKLISVGRPEIESFVKQVKTETELGWMELLLVISDWAGLGRVGRSLTGLRRGRVANLSAVAFIMAPLWSIDVELLEGGEWVEGATEGEPALGRRPSVAYRSISGYRLVGVDRTAESCFPALMKERAAGAVTWEDVRRTVQTGLSGVTRLLRLDVWRVRPMGLPGAGLRPAGLGGTAGRGPLFDGFRTKDVGVAGWAALDGDEGVTLLLAGP